MNCHFLVTSCVVIYWDNGQTVPTTSSNDTPVRVATNVRPMKLIDLAGLM